MFASRWLARRVFIHSWNLLPKTNRHLNVYGRLTVATAKYLSCNYRFYCSSPVASQENALKEKFVEFRECVQNSGRLPTKQLIDEILNAIDRGEQISPDDALFLISSCELAVDSTQSERRQYFKRIVESLESGRFLNASHYNRILEISLKEPILFRVLPFIAKWHTNGFEANTRTGVLLKELLSSRLAKRNVADSELILRVLMNCNDCQNLDRCITQVIGLHIDNNKLPTAVDLYLTAQAKLPALALDQSQCRLLLEYLFAAGRASDALELATHIKEGLPARPRQALIAWKSVLKAIESKCSVSELEKLYEVLLANNAFVVNGSSFAPLIRRHLNDGDVEKAIQLFYKISDEYKATPCLNMILIKLIESKEVDHLERIVAIALRLHGKRSLYELACAFIECDRMVEAQNIFANVTWPNQSSVLKEKTDYFYETGNDVCLEKLLTAVDGYVYASDREYILERILMARCRRSDPPDQILALCDEMTLKPSADCLQNLNYYLTRQNRSMPDKWIESLPPPPSSSSATSKSAEKSVFHQLIDAGDKMDEAKTTISDALESGGEIRLERKSLRYFLATSATNGDIDTFDRLRTQLDADTKLQLFFSKFDCRAHINTNRSCQYMELLSDVAAAANTNTKKMILSKGFPLEAYEILEKSPDLCEKFQEMAIKYSKLNVQKPMCLLWLFHLAGNNLDECNRMRKDYKLPDEILCKLGTDLFMKRKDNATLELLGKTLDKTRISKAPLARLYQCLLEAQLHHKRYDHVANTLRTALEFVTLRDIKPATLDKIRFGGPDLASARTLLITKSK